MSHEILPLSKPKRNGHESEGQSPLFLGMLQYFSRSVARVLRFSGRKVDSTERQRFEREFAGLQIKFATIVARVLNIPLSKALENYTALYRRFKLPLDQNHESDVNNSVWKQFLSHIGDKERLISEATDIVCKESLIQTDTCFSYAYDERDKAVNIHFANNDSNEHGPLSDKRIPVRREELKAMFAVIKQKHPDAERVRGSSWIFNLPKYRDLFPENYTDRMGTPRCNVTTMSIWGQFIDRQGRLRHDQAEKLLTHAEKARSEEELLEAFPLRELSVGCRIVDFYRFYEIT